MALPRGTDLSRLAPARAWPAAALAVLACAACSSASDPVPPSQHVHSRPDLRPPLVEVLTPAHGTAPGYLFLAPKKEVDQTGPLILDDRGRVVWFDPLDTGGVTDFRVQRYRGRPVLTWWRGQTEKGVGDGRYVIADSSYRVIANVRAGNGLSGDIHEFRITPQNTALFTVYRKVPYDLSALGGPKGGKVNEGVVQEVDIPTGRVLFEWHSLRHVGVGESYAPLPKDDSDPYDYFHVNAIEVEPDGNLLVSARHTHAAYEIRRGDGAVLWRLGGKRSDFRMEPGTRFAWQHDVRRQPDGTITVFDNDADHPQPGRESRVLVLRVDERRHTATLVRSYAHPQPLLSTSQGNGQFLPDGHLVVGWGSQPYVTEFDPAGHVLLDLRFGSGGADSYRAYRFPWRGSPSERPALAVEVGGGGTTVYASWNGATEVASWRVLGGVDRQHLAPVATAPRTGFETAVPVVSAAHFFAVEALDAGGRMLGRSLPRKAPPAPAPGS